MNWINKIRTVFGDLPVNYEALANLPTINGQPLKGNIDIEAPSTTRLAEIPLPAASWVGTASPYSQVVAIEGVTVTSKVDLQPSVEQLAIFHQKDLAFVTENEDGVVTVYAIGDKPTADYIIQATITEVSA